MIVLPIEYPCVSCGLTLRRPIVIKPPTLPCRLDGVTVPELPDGWTYDAQGVHCPAHQPSRIMPVAVMPSLVGLNGGKH